METTSRIYVAGHRGLVGSAIVRALQKSGYTNLLVRTSAELDLTAQDSVKKFFQTEKPEYVFLAAAKVGGIIANRESPVDFLYQNIMIEMNTIHAAAENDVKKLLFMGSSCIFPKHAEQPLRESSLLTGALEETNEAYSIAKIAGLKLTEYYFRERGKKFISVMPPNMYGPNDNFHSEHSHVIPGLIRRFHEAKVQGQSEVVVWGTGAPLREFMYSDDLADGCIFLMQDYEKPEFINLGTGEEVSIRALAELIQEVVGFNGSLRFDQSKPDGTPRKVMDSSKIRELGWAPVVRLKDGLKAAYDSYSASLLR